MQSRIYVQSCGRITKKEEIVSFAQVHSQKARSKSFWSCMSITRLFGKKSRNVYILIKIQMRLQKLMDPVVQPLLFWPYAQLLISVTLNFMDWTLIRNGATCHHTLRQNSCMIVLHFSPNSKLRNPSTYHHWHQSFISTHLRNILGLITLKE